MTISTKNINSGTNGILPHRTKRDITLDLQKQKYDLKSNRKSIYSALICYKMHILFEQISLCINIFLLTLPFFDTDSIDEVECKFELAWIKSKT